RPDGTTHKQYADYVAEFGHLMLVINEIYGKRAPKIREIPDEIRFLTELKKFELGDCDSLVKISPFIVKLPKLKTLLIRDCPKLKELPETFLELPDYIDFQILRCENMHFSKLFKGKLKEIDPFFCWKWIGNSNSL
ncbi:MAG: hypothetical protein DRO88_13530, partial [Promethearchaeia archaeon]